MNTDSYLPQTALMERVSRIRTRVFVELTTGIAAVDRERFVPLCQDYESVSSTHAPLMIDKFAQVDVWITRDQGVDSWKDKWDDWNDWNDWENGSGR